MKYYLSPELKFKTFKKLWDSVPVDMKIKNLDKVIWELMRDKMLLVVYENGDFRFPKELKGKYYTLKNGSVIE